MLDAISSSLSYAERRSALLDWEESLLADARVIVRWGYGSGFRVEGSAVVLRFNRCSVRVRLLVPARNSWSVWPAGTEITVPRVGAANWCDSNGIFPVPPAPLLRSKEHMEVR